MPMPVFLNNEEQPAPEIKPALSADLATEDMVCIGSLEIYAEREVANALIELRCDQDVATITLCDKELVFAGYYARKFIEEYERGTEAT